MQTMNIDELKTTVASIEEQYTNLSNPEWVSQQLHRLKGQYDILNQVIANLESNPEVKETPDAPDNTVE